MTDTPRFDMQWHRKQLDTWLEGNGIGGLQVSEGVLDEEVFDSLKGLVAGVLCLHWWTSYETPSQIRNLLAGLTEQVQWVDPCIVKVQPVSSVNHFEVVVDLCMFDPTTMLKAECSLDALRGDNPTHTHLSDVVKRAIEEMLGRMPAGKRRRFEENIQEYLDAGPSRTGNDEVKAFESSLARGVRALARDYRLLRDLTRSHRGLVRYFDDWEHDKRLDPSGRPVGMELRLPVWTAFESSYSSHVLPESGDAGKVDSKPANAEELYGKLIKGPRNSNEQEAACSLLMDLPHDEAAAWQLRALGCPDVDSSVIPRVIGYPEVGPFFEKLALAESMERVDSALRQMRNYGVEFDDPLRAWELSIDDHGQWVSEFDQRQQVILWNLPQYRPESVPAIVAELREAAATPDVTLPDRCSTDGRRVRRTARWLGAALTGLSVSRSREACPVVRALIRRGNAEVRAHALTFFRRVDDPEAVPLLFEALSDQDIGVVVNAEHGICGQKSVGEDELYQALQTLDRRAGKKDRSTRDAPGRGGYLATCRRSKDDLGRGLLSAVTRFGVPASKSRKALLKRVARRVSYLEPDAQALVNLVRSGRDIGSPEAPLGCSPEETYQLRYSLWRRPGYVTSRYDAKGHRGPWDSWVREGHTHYDADRMAPAGPLYKQAIDAGCHDAIVFYRYAVAVSDSTEQAIHWLEQAAHRLPGDYPDSPYLSLAWESIGDFHKEAGREEAALEAYQRAAASDVHSPEVTDALAEMESTTRLSRMTPDSIVPLTIGKPRSRPTLRHAAPVTALSISPDGKMLGSADSAGWVQVSRIDDREILPAASCEVHTPGPVSVVWADERSLLSVGSDGRLCHIGLDAEENGLVVREEFRHTTSLTAITVCSQWGVILGDNEGQAFVFSVKSAVPLPGERADGAISLLLVQNGWLVAQDTRGHIQVWSLNPIPKFVLRDDRSMAFVSFMTSDHLLAGFRDGNGVCLELPSGRELRGSADSPQGDQPSYVRYTPRGGAVYAWPSGSIRITEGPRPTVIGIEEPLEAVCADPELRIVAFANGSHKLGAHRWQE